MTDEVTTKLQHSSKLLTYARDALKCTTPFELEMSDLTDALHAKLVIHLGRIQECEVSHSKGSNDAAHKYALSGYPLHRIGHSILTLNQAIASLESAISAPALRRCAFLEQEVVQRIRSVIDALGSQDARGSLPGWREAFAPALPEGSFIDIFSLRDTFFVKFVEGTREVLARRRAEFLIQVHGWVGESLSVVMNLIPTLSKVRPVGAAEGAS